MTLAFIINAQYVATVTMSSLRYFLPMIRSLTFTLLLWASFVCYSQEKKNPSFEEIISLASAGNALISPDGTDVLFSITNADWENNQFDSELWLSRDGQEPFQLTNLHKSGTSGAEWSPDGTWIAYVAPFEEKPQVHVIRSAGGASFVLTNAKKGVEDFEWHPSGTMIAFTQSPDQPAQEERKEKFGAFSVEDNENTQSTLWVVPFRADKLGEYPLPAEKEDSVLQKGQKAIQLFPENKLSVAGFNWSPDGSNLALTLQPDQDILSFIKSDVYIYHIADSSLEKVISNPGPDAFLDWSPDGRSILFGSTVEDTSTFFYKNGRIFRHSLNEGSEIELGKDFDESLNGVTWTPRGIYALAWQKSIRKLVRIDPDRGSVQVLTNGPERIYQASFSRNGEQLALVGANDADLPEIYVARLSGDQKLTGMKPITNLSGQIAGWAVSNSEMISWKSEDETVIEGVLHKPQDYDPARKYPLLVAIHGGPTGISVPSPTPAYVYPIVQWLNKGALVLQPNYRGSAGYGEAFRSLNVRNLGVGDAWDVLAGVDYLEKEGRIDGDRVGVMGWSQGGYISAYLTTTSDKFKAVSVGAGISNWMTYYVNTDIHPFTRQYLEATPWSDEEIYRTTSPMTFINNASTPTLIQHGEFDRRVPIPNAYELYQGLQDVGVDTKLIVYKGFGHGITKPKERLAAMWHNWQWFGKYIWDEDIELPE